ncbi:MAG: hypothetical protein C0168_01390 [Candidatus Aminicenantes bacterium]|nr:MAG: hypothetical protein C0168_01390 [Candidatus Aminicenantes bacterium]
MEAFFYLIKFWGKISWQFLTSTNIILANFSKIFKKKMNENSFLQVKSKAIYYKIDAFTK